MATALVATQGCIKHCEQKKAVLTKRSIPVGLYREWLPCRGKEFFEIARRANRTCIQGERRRFPSRLPCVRACTRDISLEARR